MNEPPEPPAPRLSELPDGIHPAIPAERYHERIVGILSNSAISQLVPPKTPAHYHRWVTAPQPKHDSPALILGRALHTAVLEPELFDAQFVVEPEWGDCRVPATRQKRAEWRAKHEGRTILSLDERETVVGMATSVREHPLAAKMLVGGIAESTILWTDPETGVRCRVRPDYWVQSRELVADLKSTSDASEAAFLKSVFTYGYHRQHALYRAGCAAVGKPAKHFVFIVVEKHPPYAVATYKLDDHAIAIGHKEVRRASADIRDCMNSGYWPGFPISIRTLDTPKWRQEQEST